MRLSQRRSPQLGARGKWRGRLRASNCSNAKCTAERSSICSVYGYSMPLDLSLSAACATMSDLGPSLFETTEEKTARWWVVWSDSWVPVSFHARVVMNIDPRTDLSVNKLSCSYICSNP